MRPLLKSIAAASLALAGATGAHASGTVNPGGATAGSQQLYNAGKAVFAQRLACASCPYAGRRASAELAREVLADAKTIAMLDHQEQAALRTYFEKRFGVTQQ